MSASLKTAIDFENFVKKYSAIKQLADQIKTDPAQAIDFLVAIGNEVLYRSTEILLVELDERLKPFLQKNHISMDQENIEKIASIIIKGMTGYPNGK